MQKLTVIGSINMDLVARVDRFPKPGETLTGTSFTTVPGGKGANQAVTLARLGANVAMVGRVGEDAFGDTYLRSFEKDGVDTTYVGRGASPTGIAMIEVDASGENNIVVVPGANRDITPEWLESMPDTLFGGIVLMQLEIPMESVLFAARRIARLGGTLVLDPAPMQPMPDELLELAAILTPNEHELTALTADIDAPFQERMRELARKGARCVLHKRGAHGAYLLREGTILHMPPVKVEAVDTTGAGDAFNAALAYALAKGKTMEEAMETACRIAALSVTYVGGQGLPSLVGADDAPGL